MPFNHIVEVTHSVNCDKALTQNVIFLLSFIDVSTKETVIQSVRSLLYSSFLYVRYYSVAWLTTKGRKQKLTSQQRWGFPSTLNIKSSLLMEGVSGLDRMSAAAVVMKQQQQQKQISNVLFS